MSIEPQARPFPTLLRILLAPAHWLERARGRRRLRLALLYLFIVFMTGFLVWWATSLKGLPDWGEPFDVAAFRVVNVPDEENAFVLYHQARDRLHPLDREREEYIRWDPLLPWREVPQKVCQWVEDNHDAIEIFRRGSERSRALFIAPGEIALDSVVLEIYDLRDLTRLALLEGSRLQEAGDLPGAWVWFRAGLRASRHAAGYSSGIQRHIATEMLLTANNRILLWAADPQTDASLLHKAIREVAACERMSPPVSETLKVEYLALTNKLAKAGRLADDLYKNDVVWYYHLPGGIPTGLFLDREPERSERVGRLLFANWLAQCDKPIPQRPMAQGRFLIFDLDPQATYSARALPPPALERWVLSTMLLKKRLPPFFRKLVNGKSDVQLLQILQLTLAEQCYLREHGAPPKTLGALVGPYLESLPEGYTAAEPSLIEPPDKPAAPANNP